MPGLACRPPYKALAAAVAVSCSWAGVALAEVDPLSGIDFVTVGAVNNPAWGGDGTPGDRFIGRGSVGYEYRIGRYEVTTAQWVEFFNAAFDRPADDRLPHLIPPGRWGAVGVAATVPGGQRWAAVPGREMWGVGNISWRMAAMYCNWLHNGRSADRAAFLSGAYDVSTFGTAPTAPFGFTDQLTRSPGARYFIPSQDEWLKAAHFDPDRHGPGQGGWWLYSTTSDVMPAYGPPGERVSVAPNTLGPDPSGPFAQVNARWQPVDFPGYEPSSIALGSYPTVTSPWGLLDAAGATSEWTEGGLFVGPGLAGRYFEGSAWYTGGGHLTDRISFSGGDFPQLSTLGLGFRIAAQVPAPGSGFAIAIGLLYVARRNHRRPASWDGSSAGRR